MWVSRVCSSFSALIIRPVVVLAGSHLYVHAILVLQGTDSYGSTCQCTGMYWLLQWLYQPRESCLKLKYGWVGGCIIESECDKME